MTDYPFHKVAVYDQLGGVVRLARNSRIDVTDPATGLVAAGLKVSGVSVSFVTTDAQGQADFTSTLGTVDITSPNGLTERISSHVAIEAAVGAGISNDAGVAALLANSASATRVAGDVVYPVKSAFPRSLADYGVLPGNTAAQNRTGFAAAQASGYVDFVLPPGNYAWSAASEGQWAMTFTNASKVRIRGVAATITDSTTYTNNGALTGLFKLDNCTGFETAGIEYVGPVLGSPGTLLGYQGATVIQAINGTDGVKVDMRITNARYGVQTGNYSTPSEGGCKNFDIRLRTSFCGYPVAAYLAEGMRLDIDSDDVHRSIYLAGCNDVDFVARVKNNYIAAVMVLITDALTSGTDAAAEVAPPANPTTSRACTNIRGKVYDKGSTTYLANSYLAGISLSRVDAMAYKNIDIECYLTATDTVATTLHGFIINSTANSIWPRYTNNWEPTVLLENIKFRTFINKSACTVATATGSDGPVTLRTDDPVTPTKFGTIRNLVWEDSEIRPGSSGSYIARVYVRGLATPMTVKRVISPNAAGTPNLYVLMAGSTTFPVEFDDCSIATLDRSVVPTALVTLRGRTAITSPDVDGTFGSEGGTIRGTGRRGRVKVITTAALSGPSQTLTGAIPAGATDVRVTGRVITAITGASGFQLGVSGDVTRYADRAVTGTGNLVGPEHHAASAFSTGAYASATDLVVTAKTANFTAGVIRFAIHYDEFPAVLS